jgi:hypothetical protein
MRSICPSYLHPCVPTACMHTAIPQNPNSGNPASVQGVGYRFVSASYSDSSVHSDNSEMILKLLEERRGSFMVRCEGTHTVFCSHVEYLR